jgi:hypothetical protein
MGKCFFKHKIEFQYINFWRDKSWFPKLINYSFQHEWLYYVSTARTLTYLPTYTYLHT